MRMSRLSVLLHFSYFVNICYFKICSVTKHISLNHYLWVFCFLTFIYIYVCVCVCVYTRAHHERRTVQIFTHMFCLAFHSYITNIYDIRMKGIHFGTDIIIKFIYLTLTLMTSFILTLTLGPFCLCLSMRSQGASVLSAWFGESFIHLFLQKQ